MCAALPPSLARGVGAAGGGRLASWSLSGRCMQGLFSIYCWFYFVGFYLGFDIAWFACRCGVMLPWVIICSWTRFYSDITILFFMLLLLLMWKFRSHGLITRFGPIV